MAMESPITHRQRKQVYMNSTIFAAEGPTDRSIYLPQEQQAALFRVDESISKGPTSAVARLEMGTAPNRKQEQLHGSDTVPASANPNLNTTAYTDHQTIPAEYWSTSTALQWHDQRNEQCRPKYVDSSSARDKKAREMSSELFDTQRRSTLEKKGSPDLLSTSQHFLNQDSSRDREAQKRRQDLVSGRDRFVNNLGNSQADVFHDGQSPNARPRAQAVANEDPETVDRRKTEKNFSELFGHSVPPPARASNRAEVNHTSAVSWLDTRSEIAWRNGGGDKEIPADVGGRKFREMSSTHFESRKAVDPVDREQDRIYKEEVACWKTPTIMTTASEITRRGNTKDYYGQNESSGSRKHRELDSSSGMLNHQRHEYQAPPSRSRGRVDSGEGHWVAGSRPTTAQERKAREMASAIF
mmetsp:Transcript_35026/g.91690  ORF Transcript_35026/g.91690 Transcript_35026/m.91690 type:complete len:412 (-) Transcript_35026:133-1368(-)